MTNFRVDVYTNPHKDLREALFLLSLQAVAASHEDDKIELVEKAYAVLNLLNKHAHSEDTYLHPIVRPKIVQHVSALDHAHHELDEQMELVRNALEVLAQASGDTYAANLRDFNHALNKLIGLNLIHMAQEENLLPLYWQHHAPYELFAVMLAFKSNEEPEAFPFMVALAQQHLSHDELVGAFMVIRDRLGESIYARTISMVGEPLLSAIKNKANQ